MVMGRGGRMGGWLEEGEGSNKEEGPKGIGHEKKVGKTVARWS